MSVLILVAGCDREKPRTTSKAVAPTVSRSSKTFSLKGVVRKVDVGTGDVSISHEEIPGFMAKMTMPFTLEDRSLLADVKPGDEVEGSLRVDYEGGEVKDSNLIDLVVTRRPETYPGSANPSATTPETLKPGDMVPDFAMTTQEGKPLRLSDLRGHVVVLTFIYTRCPLPEFCPAIDMKFADLARRISAVTGRAEQFRLLSVSFDPEHDTPEVLAAHAARRGARPPLWTFAAASRNELARITGPLGLFYISGTRDFDHNMRTAVIGPDGRLALLEVGASWTPAALLKAALALLPQSRK